MSVVTGREIIHNYGEGDVLRNVGFALEAGDRVGLVGPNGEGKTTLLRIVGGLLEPTAGRVDRRKGIAVGYLPQDAPTFDGGTLWQVMDEVFADVHAMAAEMESLHERLDDPAALKRYADVQHEFEVRGGYTIDVKCKTVLTGLGFAPDEYDRPITQFSGGQRTRAMLGRLLLTEPDVLLLDEPTNHLDLDAVEWLERYLSSFPKTLLIVSHDRYFLDHTTTGTWEVAFGQLETYRGNYSAYLKQREHRFNDRMRIWREQQQYIQKTEEFIRRHHAASRSKEARGRRTRLERFLRDEAVDKPRRHKQIHMRLTPSRRSGDLALRIRDLSAGYEPGKPVVAMEDHSVQRGERIAILGGNGTGKTTLLRALLGELEPLGGGIELGAKVHVGYLPQTHDRMDPNVTALETVRSAGDVTTEQARTLLGSFLLTEDEVFKTFGQLSGGQRSRVILASLAVQGANLLMLDEPTNHLDIPSREVLQEALSNFEGTVLLVSHDRYLIAGVATQVWAVDDGQVCRIPGSWDNYIAWRSNRQEAPPADAKDAGAKPAKRIKPKDARKQRQRLQRRQERLEEEVHALEAKLGELTEEISQASMDEKLGRVHELGETYQQSEHDLKALWEEWAQVTEALEE